VFDDAVFQEFAELGGDGGGVVDEELKVRGIGA